MEVSEFLKLFRLKKREIIISAHAQKRLVERTIRKQDIVSYLNKSEPVAVQEQEQDEPNLRVFRIYYRQSAKYFHTYIISINSKILLKSAWRTIKPLQKALSKGAFKFN